MKNYQHVVEFVNRQAWAILPETLAIIKDILALRVEGFEFTKEEIQAKIGDKKTNEPQFGGPVAVLPLRGVISHRMGMMSEMSGGTSTERFTKMLRKSVADSSVGSIVIDVDSPGGTVSGVQELAEEIVRARAQKHIVAVANATMASAAYWIGSAANEIVATPSADRLGSIGVFTMHVDESEALKAEGVKVTLISAGEKKVDGNPFEPLPDEVRNDIQTGIDAAYERFVKGVAKGRGVSVAKVKSDFGQGATLDAKEALAVGMIDRIATLDETITRMAKGNKRSGARAEGGIISVTLPNDVKTISVTAGSTWKPCDGDISSSGSGADSKEKPFDSRGEPAHNQEVEDKLNKEAEEREKEAIETEREREVWRNRMRR